MNTKVKAILLDFGNVVIPIDFRLTFQAFASLSFKKAEVVEKAILESGVIQRYEMGMFTDDEFREIIRQVIGYPFNDDEIDHAWNALLLPVPPARIQRIEELKQRCPVYLLSNTNPLHIRECDKIFQRSFGLPNAASLFTHAFYSYEMGLWKPDPAIYQEVVDSTGFAAQEILFLDDLEKNILAAREVGLQAVQVTPDTDMLEILADF